MEQHLSDPPEALVDPDTSPPLCAVLVLSGSSGRLGADRARRFTAHVASAAATTCLAGPQQPPGSCEVALETSTPVLDMLVRRSEHLVVRGSSEGAEAALPLAAADHRIRTVIAVAPSAYVWANTGSDRDGRERPWRSSWTCHEQPLPFLPVADDWEAGAAERGPDGVAVRGWYEASLAAASSCRQRPCSSRTSGPAASTAETVTSVHRPAAESGKEQSRKPEAERDGVASGWASSPEMIGAHGGSPCLGRVKEFVVRRAAARRRGRR